MDVVSKREKPKYSHNGHQYVFDKLTKDGSKKMWRCDRKDHGCKARLHTDAATDDVIGDVRGAHTHGSDAAGVEVAVAVGGMTLKDPPKRTLTNDPFFEEIRKSHLFQF